MRGIVLVDYAIIYASNKDSREAIIIPKRGRTYRDLNSYIKLVIQRN